MSEINDTAIRLADTAKKLLAEVERLRRDVVVLSNRIEGVDGERHVWTAERAPPNITSFKDAFDVLEQSRRIIETCEYHFRATRSLVDSFQTGAIPREELAPFIKAETPRARPVVRGRPGPRGRGGGS